MGGGNLQAFIADGGGDIVQQTGPVPAVDFDNGMPVRGPVIDHHARRHVDHPHSARQQRAGCLTNFAGEFQPARTAPVQPARTAGPAGAASRKVRRRRPGSRTYQAPCRRSAYGSGQSTIEAPAMAKAPAMRLNSPAWSAVYTTTSVTARAGSGSALTVKGADRRLASRIMRAWRSILSGSNPSQ